MQASIALSILELATGCLMQEVYWAGKSLEVTTFLERQSFEPPQAFHCTEGPHLSLKELHCLLKAMSFRQSLDGFALKTAMILSQTCLRSSRASSLRFATGVCSGVVRPGCASLAMPILSLTVPAGTLPQSVSSFKGRQEESQRCRVLAQSCESSKLLPASGTGHTLEGLSCLQEHSPLPAAARTLPLA